MLALQVVLTVAGLSAVSAASTSGVYHRKNALTSLGNGSKNDLEAYNQKNFRQTKDEAESGMEEQEDKLNSAAAASRLPVCGAEGQRPPIREFNSSRSGDIIAPCAGWAMVVGSHQYLTATCGILCSAIDPEVFPEAFRKFFKYTMDYMGFVYSEANKMAPIPSALAILAANALETKLTTNSAAWETSHVACNADRPCIDKANEAAITRNTDATDAFVKSICS